MRSELLDALGVQSDLSQDVGRVLAQAWRVEAPPAGAKLNRRSHLDP